MFDRFSTRSLKSERLDTGDFTPIEYARWHREMWFIHRMFGEVRALRGSLVKALRADERDRISVMDVGAGSGGLLRSLNGSVADKRLTLIGAEFSSDAVESIKRAGGDVDPVRCDALRLPFDDNGVDYIFSSLMLHHLTDDEAILHLSEMGRVARKRFFVIDLRRSPVAYYFYRLVGRLFLQGFTREDGALSILRSFRPDELWPIARGADLDSVSIERSALYRLVLSGSKRS